MKKIYLLFLFLIFFITACTTQPQQEQTTVSGNTIEISDDGFNPTILTGEARLGILVGDTVTWINKGSIEHWPASAIHPTHAVYPEPGGCIGSKFDACKGLKQGESWSFVFTQKGSWNYHDHLNPTLFGKIIVQ